MHGNNGNAAFMELYSSWYLYTHNMALRYTPPSCITADDITQEVWIKLWTRREELAQVENMAAYLKRCIVFAVRNFQRDEDARLLRNEIFSARQETVAPGADEQLMDHELQFFLAEAISNLPLKRREMVQLRLDNHSTAEIAATLQVSQKTVQNQLLNSIPSMRAYLGQRCLLN